MQTDISPGRRTWHSLPFEETYDPAVPRMVFNLLLEVSYMNFIKSLGKAFSPAMMLRMLPNLAVHTVVGPE